MKRIWGVTGSAALLALGVLAGCGQDSGYLYGKRTIQQEAQPGERPSFALTEARYSRLTWFQPCPSDAATPPAPGRNEIVLSGAGPHRVYRERMFDVPVVMRGRVCQPRSYDRDVVVLIEVAGATNFMDPYAGGTCKRFEALKTVLDSLPAGSNFAVVTAEEVVAAASSRFFDTKTALYADLTGNPSATEADAAAFACGAAPAGTGGPANFDVAFAKVKSLLESGRPSQTKKEVIFMADGYGTTTIPSTIAKQIATEITTTGVDVGGEKIIASIGTLHVSSTLPGSGTGAFVHQFATADRTGAKLSGDVQQAAGVASAIGTIAANLIAGNHVRLRPIGATAWQDVDAFPHMAGFDYALPPLMLAIDLQQTGFEMETEYWDTHGNRTQFAGQIVWMD